MPTTIAVANGKGGVGKTSLVAHLLGYAAVSGWRCLGVDLDPQGNLARDLGYVEREENDGGEGLFRAVMAKVPLAPIPAVRANLDVISGGPGTRMLSNNLALGANGMQNTGLDALRDALAPLLESYDLAVLDLPPGDSFVQQAAFRLADHVVVPTTGDDAANDGLSLVLENYEAARPANPGLRVLGIVVTQMQTGAKAMLRETLADLESIVNGRVRIFAPPVRYAKKAARDCRHRGLLAFEYEDAGAKAPKWYELRQTGKQAMSYAENASGLATDYQQLTEAILAAATIPAGQGR